MADIFLSYAREDMPRVAPLANALADRGWSVWWDRHIPPGKTFDEVIESNLAEARAVICCWTEQGVKSMWVKTEADEGADRGILVPVLLDDVQISLAFRRIQAADLTDWEPGVEHAGFTELVNALEGMLGRAPVTDLTDDAEERVPLAHVGREAAGQGIDREPSRPPLIEPEPTASAPPPTDPPPTIVVAPPVHPTAPSTRGDLESTGETEEKQDAHRTSLERPSPLETREPDREGEARPQREASTVRGRPSPPLRWLEELPLTPTRLAGVAAGVLALIALLVIISSRGDGTVDTTGTNTASTGVAEVQSTVTTAAQGSPGTSDTDQAAELQDRSTQMALVAPDAPTAQEDPACVAKCAFIDSIQISGDSMVVQWTEVGFVPNTGADHAHFYWSDIEASQAGSNAADFGVSRGNWELTDDQPFTSSGEMRLSQRPAGADQVCLTVANGNHGVIDPSVFVCEPLPTVFTAWETRFTDPTGGTNALAPTPSGGAVLAYLSAEDGRPDEVRIHTPAVERATIGGSPDGGDLIAVTVLTDGRPVVAFDARAGLFVAVCNDETCSSSETVEIDDAMVDALDISIGPDGVPVLAYFDVGRAQFRVAHCGDTSCTRPEIHHVDADARESHSGHVSLAHGSDGTPVMAYTSAPNEILLMTCSDPACSEASIVPIGDDAADAPHTSLVVGADGNPQVAYLTSEGAVTVVNCRDPQCAASTTSSPPGEALVELSAASTASGYALLVGRNAEGATVLGYCGSGDCAAATWVRADESASTAIDVLAPAGDVPAVSRVTDEGLTLHRLTP